MSPGGFIACVCVGGPCAFARSRSFAATSTPKAKRRERLAVQSPGAAGTRQFRSLFAEVQNVGARAGRASPARGGDVVVEGRVVWRSKRPQGLRRIR